MSYWKHVPYAGLIVKGKLQKIHYVLNTTNEDGS